MRKKFAQLLLLILIVTHVSPAWAMEEIEIDHWLVNRKESWPNWHLPDSLKYPGFKDDLVYPDWFQGDWKVTTLEINESTQPTFSHLARFLLDPSNRVVADREYNVASLGKSVFGDELIVVKNDPKTPNRQFSKFKSNRYLETTIIGRREDISNKNIFYSDELTLEVFYLMGQANIKQVETLSRFSECKSSEISDLGLPVRSICGEQFVAIYAEPGNTLFLAPDKVRSYKLILTPI